MILEAHPSRGPCSDVAKFKVPIKQATERVKIAVIVGDAGYDSESNHQFGREQLSVRNIIPRQRRTADKKACIKTIPPSYANAI